MLYDHVLIERDGPVGTVVLNRSAQLNALSGPMLADLVGALEELQADAHIRAIVVTGGEKVFAAGADLKEMSEASSVDMLLMDRVVMWERVKKITKPLVAAVSGYALGGGNELVMLCDLVVASESARFGQPEINVGLIPGAGGTQRLTRTAGKARAMEMVMLGKQIDAWEAQSVGLVNRVVPVELLLEEARALADELAEKPPLSLRLAKEAVIKAFESSLEAGLDYERKLFYLLFSTQDAHEGMQAFIEKRKPSYQGK